MSIKNHKKKWNFKNLTFLGSHPGDESFMSSGVKPETTFAAAKYSNQTNIMIIICTSKPGSIGYVHVYICIYI